MVVKKLYLSLYVKIVGLIWSIVRRFNNRNYELEDLYQIGCIGFIKAIKNFDFTLDNKLSTYATYMVIGEIKRFLRDNGPIKVSRSLKEIATKVKELQENSVREKGIELTIEEISNVLKIEKEDIVIALDASLLIESIDRKIGDEDGQTVGDKLADKRDDYEKVLNEITIEKALEKLDEQEKKIIIFRYYREKTQTQIADILGISQVQVSRIEKRALTKMRYYS